MIRFFDGFPGIDKLLIAFGIFLGIFILICYVSFVVAIIEEEEALKRQRKLDAKKKKEMDKNDEQREIKQDV